MREILFKAKRIDNGEWVEGYYSKSPHPFLGFLKDFIFAPYYDLKQECGYDSGYQIDLETLCQYTGLTDKNGNKIWENDVVSMKYFDCTSEGIIRYRKENARFVYRELGDGDYGFDDTCEIEVIGNIFDNPELMEAGGKHE